MSEMTEWGYLIPLQPRMELLAGSAKLRPQVGTHRVPSSTAALYDSLVSAAFPLITNHVSIRYICIIPYLSYTLHLRFASGLLRHVTSTHHHPACNATRWTRSEITGVSEASRHYPQSPRGGHCKYLLEGLGGRQPPTNRDCRLL